MVFEVVAIISPAEGKEDRIREGLQDMAKHVQENEHACLKYQVYEQTNHKGLIEFVVVEEYGSSADFDSHLSSEMMKQLGETIKADNLLAKPLDIKTVKKCCGFSSR